MTPRTTLRRAAFLLRDAVSLLCLLLFVGGVVFLVMGVTV